MENFTEIVPGEG